MNLFSIFRFVMPTTDHILKKLLLVFWEVVPKFGQDGKLLHEFILVCDAYRKVLSFAGLPLDGLEFYFARFFLAGFGSPE